MPFLYKRIIITKNIIIKREKKKKKIICFSYYGFYADSAFCCDAGKGGTAH